MRQQALLLPFIHECKEQAWGSQACQTSTSSWIGLCQMKPDCCFLLGHHWCGSNKVNNCFLLCNAWEATSGNISATPVLKLLFLNRCLSLQRILLNSTRIKFRSKNKIRFGRCRKNYGGPRLGKVSTPTPREPCPRGNWGQLTAGVNEKSEQESCGGCSKVLDYGSEFRSRAVVVAQ